MSKPQKTLRVEMMNLNIEMKKVNNKIDVSVERLDKKIDDCVERLDMTIERLDTTIERLDTTIERLDKIDSSVDRLALSLLNTQERLSVVENNMATKADIDRVIGIVLDFSKKTDIVLQNQEVHRGYIHDHEARLIALERPLY
jgi:hypothetical protein